MYVCMRACVHACMPCMRACVRRACMRVYVFVHIYIYTHTHMGVAQHRCWSRSPPLSQTFVTGPLRALCYKRSSRASVESTAVFNRLVAGRVCRKTPHFVTSLVAKRPPRPVTSPMFLSRCHVCIYIYTHHVLCTCIQYTRNLIQTQGLYTSVGPR